MITTALIKNAGNAVNNVDHLCLWVCTGYLYKTHKNKWSTLFTALPAFFMSAVVITYIFAEPNLALGHFIPYNIALIIGLSLSVVILILYIIKLCLRKDSDLVIDEPIIEEVEVPNEEATN